MPTVTVRATAVTNVDNGYDTGIDFTATGGTLVEALGASSNGTSLYASCDVEPLTVGAASKRLVLSGIHTAIAAAIAADDIINSVTYRIKAKSLFAILDAGDCVVPASDDAEVGDYLSLQFYLNSNGYNHASNCKSLEQHQLSSSEQTFSRAMSATSDSNGHTVNAETFLTAANLRSSDLRVAFGCFDVQQADALIRFVVWDVSLEIDYTSAAEAYRALIYNASAHRRLSKAIQNRTHDIINIKVGSSHVLFGGYGQTDAAIQVLDELGFDFATGPLLGPGENTVFDDGVGSGFHSPPNTGTESLASPPASASTGAQVGRGVQTTAVPGTSGGFGTRAPYTSLPAALQEYYVLGWTGTEESNIGLYHLQPWWSTVFLENNGIGPFTDPTTLDQINQVGNIRGWVVIGDDSSFSGNQVIGIRKNSSPFTTLASKTIALGGSEPIRYEYVDLNNTETTAILLQLANTSGTANRNFTLLATFESVDNPLGSFSVHPLVAHSGGSAADISVDLQVRPSFIRVFFSALNAMRVSKPKMYLIDITVGHNDRNETEDDPASVIDALLSVVTQLVIRGVLAGIDQRDIFFRLRIDTPVSFPDDAELIAYRAELKSRIGEFWQSVGVNSESIGNATDFADWWVGGGDQVHLNSTGYHDVEARIWAGYLAAISSTGEGLSPYFKLDLTSGVP